MLFRIASNNPSTPNCLKSFYDILGISRFATQEEIKKAYILRSKMMHPDRFSQSTQKAEWDMANEMLKELNHAYGVLKDTQSRNQYDSTFYKSNQATGSAPSERQRKESAKQGTSPTRKVQEQRTARSIFPILNPGFWYMLVLIGVWGLIIKGCEMMGPHLSQDSSKPLSDVRIVPSNAEDFESNPSLSGINQYFGGTSYLLDQAALLGNRSTNPVIALKGFLQKANGGDKWSAWLIGDLYYKNTEAPYFNEAIRWFRKAAEQGDAKYQYQLGSLLERTHPQEAIEWYKKSAKQDYGDAQYALGYHYLYSKGGDKDPSTACDYLLKSAKHGDPTAMSIVSELYYTGDGVPKDQLEGLAWMYLAAGSGTGWPLYRQWQEYVAQWEKQIGSDYSLKAQLRAKELKKDIKMHSGL